jgi:hypothetical protein
MKILLIFIWLYIQLMKFEVMHYSGYKLTKNHLKWIALKQDNKSIFWLLENWEKQALKICYVL